MGGKLSEFQLRKLRDYFFCLDMNQSGALEWDDFKRCADAVSDSLGWERDRPGHRWLLSRRKAAWDMISNSMDGDGDGASSLEELTTFFTGLCKEIQSHGGKLPRTAEGHVITLLDALDADGSGDLDAEELGAYYESLPVSVDGAAVFDLLDTNHDGRITHDELVQHFVDWVSSEQPGKAGNLLVTGRLPPEF